MPADDLPTDESLRQLYRRLAEEGPPAHLDATIRVAARRHLVRRRPWWRQLSWQVPLGVMATASLTLVLLRGPLRDEVRSTALRGDASAPVFDESLPLGVPLEENFAAEESCAPEAAPPPLHVAATPAAKLRAVAPAAPKPQAGGADAKSEAAPAAAAAEEASPQRSYGFARSRSVEVLFELTPDTPPEHACESLAPILQQHCRASRSPQGQLELVLATGDQSLHQQLFDAMVASGWRDVGEAGADGRQVFVDPEERYQVHIAREAGGLRLKFSAR